MRIRSKSRTVFVPADCTECSGELSNPARGWYHVYTFGAQSPADKRPVEEEIWLDESCRQERLALVLIDLGAFQLAPLSGDALEHIGQILRFFRQNQKQLLLRFTYDTMGKGMEHEPPVIAWIKGHMEQIGGVIEPYLDDIFVLQGIFVGSWGEMHGSKFLDETSMCELVNTVYRMTRGRCFLAVRTPAQWRTIAGSANVQPEAVKRLGLFNDGIFGSPTDLGTYGSTSGAEKTEKRTRSEELEWQEQKMFAVPSGGEVLSGQPLKSFRQAEQDLRKMHLCYLNSIYHPLQLEHWKNETVEEPGCWQGVSGYDYLGRHLGYRFSVVDVAQTWDKKLRITVQNSGFGSLHEAADCFLGIETGPEKMKWQLLNTDAGSWKSGEKTVLCAVIPKEWRTAGGRLHLQLRRRLDGCALHFANQGAGESVFLGGFQ